MYDTPRRSKNRLADIGVWEGVTTGQLRSIMDEDGVCFAINPYPNGQLGFHTQQAIEKGAVGTIDCLCIDGDHSCKGLKSAWQAWHSLIALGGIVALNDCRSTDFRKLEHVGSVHCTNEIILRKPVYKVVDTVDSLTVLERTS